MPLDYPQMRATVSYDIGSMCEVIWGALEQPGVSQVVVKFVETASLGRRKSMTFNSNQARAIAARNTVVLISISVAKNALHIPMEGGGRQRTTSPTIQTPTRQTPTRHFEAGAPA